MNLPVCVCVRPPPILAQSVIPNFCPKNPSNVRTRAGFCPGPAFLPLLKCITAAAMCCCMMIHTRCDVTHSLSVTFCPHSSTGEPYTALLIATCKVTATGVRERGEFREQHRPIRVIKSHPFSSPSNKDANNSKGGISIFAN